LNISNFTERVLANWREHVPSVPTLNSTELKSLHHAFESKDHEALQNLFGRGSSIGLVTARALFYPFDLNRLIDSGLLYEENHGITSQFQFQRYHSLLLLSDFLRWESDPEFVLPVGPAGNYLALLTIRRRVESALDLGCGCGVQALLAARHSRYVVATDINSRALALTRFNAELNDIHNIETRPGSYFEPVRDQGFDLIVANLPYVITPEKRLVYRTVDQLGDAAILELLNEIPGYLNEDGFAQILINWIHRANQEPSQPIQQSIQNRNVDAWLIHNGSKAPDEYAEMWLKSDSKKYKTTKKDWVNWYHRNHIERIALGAVALRYRGNAQNWLRSVTINETLTEPAGDEILRSFAAQDALKQPEFMAA